jgi:hypothetical protein
MGFGDGDKRDLFGSTAGARSGKLDAFPHPRKIFGQFSRNGTHRADSSM